MNKIKRIKAFHAAQRIVDEAREKLRVAEDAVAGTLTEIYRHCMSVLYPTLPVYSCNEFDEYEAGYVILRGYVFDDQQYRNRGTAIKIPLEVLQDGVLEDWLLTERSKMVLAEAAKWAAGEAERKRIAEGRLRIFRAQPE